jgi:hypothetical protein
MQETVYWFNLVGQALGSIGAIYTIANPFLTKRAALEIGLPRYTSDDPEQDLKLPFVQELMRQSRKARIGLALIALGFLLQATATVLGR